MARYRINGREVTDEEYAAWSARRMAFLEAAGMDLMTGIREGTVSIGTKTDREFLRGHGANGAQFQDTPEVGDYYRQVAESRGQNTKGKVYLSGLAEFPGDPRAWVDGRGDAQRVLEERGWGGEGDVRVKAAEATGPVERVPVAPDLVENRIEQMAAADPSVLEKDPGELRHEVTEAMRPPWQKRGK